jgi:mannose-6-phosphate isomerase-like protein (cupin superfamily)
MGPGKKTPKRMNADTHEWWVVWDGQIRFTIDGQEPFVASKGSLVQVPYRNMYTMETVGDTPSLRFEVNPARARLMYALEETPVPLAGNVYVKARIAGRGKYEGNNKPLVDFNAVVAGTDRTREWVVDRDGFANIILGRGIPPPPLTDKGHFHQESAEFWFISLGQIRYNIEGVPVFVAEPGDVVYAPRQRWHLASFAGDAQSCRIAMNAFQDLGHSFEAEAAAQ